MAIETKKRPSIENLTEEALAHQRAGILVGLGVSLAATLVAAEIYRAGMQTNENMSNAKARILRTAGGLMLGLSGLTCAVIAQGLRENFEDSWKLFKTVDQRQAENGEFL